MKKNSVSDLLEVSSDLTEIYEMVLLMNENQMEDDFTLQVKGKGSDPVLLPRLKRSYKIIESYDPDGKIFGSLHNDMQSIIEYLDQNYSVKSKFWKVPEGLREQDYEKVLDYLARMLDSFIQSGKKLQISYKSKTDTKKIPKEFSTGLDKNTKYDLQEAMRALESGFTTASFMLFCRVAEQLSNSYYEKTTKNSSKDVSWNNMLKEIRNKQHQDNNVRWAALNLLGFLKEKRNKAQHPGTRFTKKDCEKIFHYLDDFQKEISK